ncbi:MAG TPA: hypothetical protein VGK64_27905 [Bryobacteraceae bacterium]
MPVNTLRPREFGVGWVTLCICFVLHIVDEALTDILSVYNPTVLALRAQLGWLPLPTFSLKAWLAVMVLVNVALLLLSPYAFRGARWMRPLAYGFAGIMILNGIGHVLGTIAGQTVASVRFSRPMSGFYSSPFLLVAAIYLLSRLRRTAR